MSENTKMTEDQIKNWRKILTGMFGAYALIMPESEIIIFKNKLQEDIDKDMDKDEQEETFGEKLSIDVS